MRILLAKTPFPSGEPGKQQQPGISWRSYSSSVCMNGRTVCWLEVLVFRFFLLLNNQIIYTGLVFSDRMARLGLLVTFSLLILVAFACGELIHGPLAPPGSFQLLEYQTLASGYIKPVVTAMGTSIPVTIKYVAGGCIGEYRETLPAPAKKSIYYCFQLCTT